MAWECVLWGSQQARQLAVVLAALGVVMVRILGLLNGAYIGLRPCPAAGLL